MSNYNGNKNYRYNYVSYSYNDINQPVKYHQWNMNKFNVLAQGLHWIKIIHQLAETSFFPNQVSNMQIEIYVMHLIFINLYLLFFCEYLESFNHTSILKIIQNGIGILVKHPVPAMIIVDHNIYQIINLHLLINVNSIVMIELRETFFPIMIKICGKWIFKIAFMLE